MSKVESEFQLYYFVRYYVTGCYGKMLIIRLECVNVYVVQDAIV